MLLNMVQNKTWAGWEGLVERCGKSPASGPIRCGKNGIKLTLMTRSNPSSKGRQPVVRSVALNKLGFLVQFRVSVNQFLSRRSVKCSDSKYVGSLGKSSAFSVPCAWTFLINDDSQLMKKANSSLSRQTFDGPTCEKILRWYSSR